MNGRIIKGIAGFYYVHVASKGLYECKAKGVFRNRNEKPLVGDEVELEITDDSAMTGNIVSIKDRKNELVRPAVANVDQALVVFAAANPEPNFHLLDCFLVRMQRENIPVIICFNKVDLIDDDILTKYMKIYEDSGCKVLCVSARENEGIEELFGLLKGKMTVLAGPSGVGKSSIMNIIYPEANASTGEISKKLGRGKHTTRHSEVFCIDDDSYLMDTPGFSSLTLPDMEMIDLKDYFPEFYQYEEQCRFGGCLHRSEPQCAVKNSVDDNIIARERYESYLLMLDEVQAQKKW